MYHFIFALYQKGQENQTTGGTIMRDASYIIRYTLIYFFALLNTAW